MQYTMFMFISDTNLFTDAILKTENNWKRLSKLPFLYVDWSKINLNKKINVCLGVESKLQNCTARHFQEITAKFAILT
jgi:hypothetical protein